MAWRRAPSSLVLSDVFRRLRSDKRRCHPVSPASVKPGVRGCIVEGTVGPSDWRWGTTSPFDSGLSSIRRRFGSAWRRSDGG